MIVQGRLKTETATKSRWTSEITWKRAVKAVCKGTPYIRRQSSGGKKNIREAKGCRQGSLWWNELSIALASFMGKTWKSSTRETIYGWTKLDSSFSLPSELLLFLNYIVTIQNTPIVIYNLCNIASSLLLQCQAPAIAISQILRGLWKPAVYAHSGTSLGIVRIPFLAPLAVDTMPCTSQTMAMSRDNMQLRLPAALGVKP